MEVPNTTKVSSTGWAPLDNTKMLFIEATPTPPAEGASTCLNLVDYLPPSASGASQTATPSSRRRPYHVVETLGLYKAPIHRSCCRKPNQKSHAFHAIVLDAEGKEVLTLIKNQSSPAEGGGAEVLLSVGKEAVGVIVQEDGRGANEVPFKYTIHDGVGPLLVGLRSDSDPVTSWSVVTYGPEPHPVAKISGRWFGVPGGGVGYMAEVEEGFGLELERHIEPEFKKYLVAFLLTIYFRFSHSCRLLQTKEVA